MRLQGRLTEWRDDQGFGFITPHGSTSKVFVHIKSFEGLAGRPSPGEIATFSVGKDARGRPCAQRVRLVRTDVREGRTSPARALQLVAAAGTLSIVVVLWKSSRLPDAIAGAYVLFSIVSIVMYALDKSAARRGTWRVQESTLQLLSLAGGWPGALAAQQLFRHKSRKQAFQTVFWTCVVLNVVAVSWLVMGGMAWLSTVDTAR